MPPAGTARMRVVALMNAGAGASSQAPAHRAHAALERCFAEHGVAAELRFLSGAQLTEAARDTLAKRGEIDAVVVGGGDGSVRTMAGVLADTGVPLGVLSLGTLNHFPGMWASPWTSRRRPRRSPRATCGWSTSPRPMARFSSTTPRSASIPISSSRASGKADQARDIDTFKTREAEIDARSSRLPVALDGEVEIMRTPLHYRSRPGALRVIVLAATA
jgi:diacylglycerol kinase family enzyme